MSSIATLPLFDALEPAQTILVSGCGGGFDIYAGVPLALALRRMGKRVILGNLTFAAPATAAGAEVITPALTRIDGQMASVMPYFPEWYLACWLRKNGHPHDVYCFERTGVVPMAEAYGIVIERESIDALLLVDGGTDSLMQGDEAGLGTPHEDITTLVAVEALTIPRYLACLGFGVDAYHHVCHAHFLENTAALARAGAFLGTFSLLAEQEEGAAYLDLVDFATAAEPAKPSIVNTSIAASVRGFFGDHHCTVRTRGSELFINPLMGIYWCYEADAVIERVMYKDSIRWTERWEQVILAVEGARRLTEGTRPYKSIPF